MKPTRKHAVVAHAPVRKQTVKEVHKEAHGHSVRDAEPELMVQLPDPKMIRKEVLESLREVIIFMQGYEKFRALQEEKVALFLKLKSDVREITTLLDTKLRAQFPKGKLRMPVHTSMVSNDAAPTMAEPRIVTQTASGRPASSSGVAAPNGKSRDELAELESQLRDIEGQLQDLH